MSDFVGPHGWLTGGIAGGLAVRNHRITVLTGADEVLAAGSPGDYEGQPLAFGQLPERGEFEGGLFLPVAVDLRSFPCQGRSTGEFNRLIGCGYGHGATADGVQHEVWG